MDSTPLARPAIVEYRYLVFMVVVPVVFGGLGIAAVTLTVGLALGSDYPPAAFSLLWLGIFVWNGYWFGVRVVHTVAICGDRLRWRAPLRGGEASLTQVRRLRPMRLASNVEVMEIAGRRPLLLFAAPGLRAFAAELAAAAPQVSVRLGWQARWAERMRGPLAGGWCRRERS